MQLYGNGVTKNFLVILEDDIRRSAKSLARTFVLVGVLGAVGLLAYRHLLAWGLGLFLLSFLLATVLGVGWGHFVNTHRYQSSIRQHWNRWMRFSVSCVTVRECYRKVHDKRATASLLWSSLLIALLILVHGVVLGLALNEESNPWHVVVLLLADAALLGFVAGVRWRERRWYRAFLKSVNELLKDGTIGVWGVY
jgi:hypothetical protein